MARTLLERVAAGDSAAIDACVRKYGGLVWSISLRLSRSREDAEDAVQEIFLNLWKTADRYDPSRSTETAWVAMVARRRLIDRKRAEARRKEDPVPAIDLERFMSFDHEKIHNCVEAQVAARAIQALPKERRMVLHLAIFEGLTHAQIAEAAKMPIGTVKSHVRRGLQAVREMLREDSVSEETRP